MDMELSGLELSSLSISKGSVYEEMTMTQAAMEDALSRQEDTISNERIRKGDRILDTYTVQDEAISGGMGSAWRVHHENWNTDLAMKRPQPKFFSEGSQRRKADFIAECENWINLGLHPNIVSCYYVREIGGVPTIFSEWMDNGSLKDRIRDGSLYQGTEAEVQERILDIAIQTARGLAYSHEKGLIHQDIKPGNILLSKNWDAKIADFGLARARSQMESGNTLSTGYTLEYCPKEQAEGAVPEAWMDIYAWALTVLEMYCGERTWKTGADLCGQPQRYAAETRVAILPQLSKLIVSCLKSKTSTPAVTVQLLDELIRIYQTVVGIAYYREAVNTLNDTANTIHNRALSYLDIGKPNIAVELWERAQKTDHTCFPAAYSYNLFLWNKGEISDTEFHNRVFSFPTSSKEVALAKLRVCLCMRSDDIELQQTIDDLNRFPLNAAEHALTEKAAAILKTPLPHAYNEEFTHFLPAKMFSDYFPNLEYTDEQIPFVIREKHGMRQLRTLAVQTAINTGQEIDEWLTGFTPDGIALMQGAWMTKRTIRLPDPDVFFPYELSKIESTEARTLAEKQVFNQYRIAKEYYEQGDYQGTVRLLRECLQNGTLLNHHPSLVLWSSLSKHFIRTKFIGVAVTQDEATPIPERNAIPEAVCQKSATVFDDYACISCDGITKLTLDYSRKVISENMNGNNDVEVEYRLTGTDVNSGNTYFRIVPFDFLCEDDDDRPISKIQVKMVEPGVFQKWSQYYAPRSMDFAHSDAIPGKVVFMLPGQIEMHNTTEGIRIGDFLIQDSLTEFRPYYDSDVISCKKYNYRLIYDYDTSSRPSGCTNLSSVSDSHSNNIDSHPSIEAASDNPKPQTTGSENLFGKITRLLRKHK